MHISEVIRTVELRFRTSEFGTESVFRIEILKDNEGFFGNVYRQECFSIQQGCGNHSGKYWDAFVYAMDIAEEWTDFRFVSVEEALKGISERVHHLFHVRDEPSQPPQK